LKSPLGYDAEIVKEFGIKDDIETEVKFGFVRSQLDEIKKALWRERVDLIMAETQVEKATEENVKAHHQQKVTERRAVIRQFVNSIEVLKALSDELEKQVTD